MKKLPLLLALLVVALGLYTLSGNSYENSKLTANVVDSKEEASKEEEVSKEEALPEVKEGEEAPKDEKPSAYDIVVASIEACETNPSDKSFAATYVEPKTITQEEADALWVAAKCGGEEAPKEEVPKEEEPSAYEVIVASISACETDPSGKSFAAEYVETKIISQEEADTLWATAKCGQAEPPKEEEPSAYDILVASISACETDPTEKSFAAEYVDTKIISQEEADTLWKAAECEQEVVLDSETIIATLKSECTPDIESKELDTYISEKIVSTEDVESAWKEGACEEKKKRLELEKKMIESFDEKELTIYLQQKEEAREKGNLAEFTEKYYYSWFEAQEKERRSQRKSSSVSTVLKREAVVDSTFSKEASEKKVPDAVKAEINETTQKITASVPAPVVITKDAPIAIPFTSESRASSGSGGGSDYRVDESTSEETKNILENIRVDSCFSEYIRPGSIRNSVDEVRKWQIFLNDYMGADLNITGVYGAQTQEAIREFQQQYAQYVLEPWELEEPTSNIYKTTRSMANYIIGCPEGEILLDELGVNYSHLEQGIKLR